MMRFKLNNQRPAFSMLMAIFVIVIMATVSALVLNLSGKMVKDTTFQFRKEQAVLLARSYTELAIMAATANESNATNCTETLLGLTGGTLADVEEGDGYKIDVKFSYIGNDLVCGNVLNTADIAMSDDVYIVVDTEVQYRDPEIIGAAGTPTDAPWVSYRRRTTQKL